VHETLLGTSPELFFVFFVLFFFRFPSAHLILYAVADERQASSLTGELETKRAEVSGKTASGSVSLCLWEEPLGSLCVSLSFVNMFLLLLLLLFSIRPVIF